MRVLHHFGHVVGGSLLIAGTTIGVGILALPIATGPGGFLPAVVIFILCWLFMLCTGLLLLEVCFWMPKDANLITMTGKLLGPAGRIVCWIVYLFLFLTVMIAHVAGGGNIVSEIAEGTISPLMAMVIYVIVFAPIVYLGAHSVDRMNLLLMLGLGITYFTLVGMAIKHIDIKLLSHVNWSKAWFAIPILFTAFTYQVIIPTLVTYMERNFKKVRLSIIIGSSIPLIIYLLWEFSILGILPVEGEYGLVRAGELGQSAVVPLKYFLENSYLFAVGKYFAFFTMTVSYVALSLAFFDFLADGLKIKKTGYRKFLLLLLIFIPPMAISLIKPDIFISALRYAGGISIAILFGLLPPLMVWIGRYQKKLPTMPHPLFGGKPLLALLIILILAELITDLFIYH
jgi:tyrosine-specific transport protein